MSHVLIADDDIALCTMLGEYLELEGFQVSLVHDGEQALATIPGTVPALDRTFAGCRFADVSGDGRAPDHLTRLFRAASSFSLNAFSWIKPAASFWS